MAKTREIVCDFQPYVDYPPVPRQALRAQACSNDGPTVDSWRNIWVKNAQATFSRFGSFKDHSLGKLWGAHKNSPAIVIGSGPSLKENVAGLKENKSKIPVISCLHNFHFLEDNGVGADYYVTLDAGPVTIEEVHEGGTKTPEEYWELTKDRTLIAYIGTDPGLFEKWRGKVYLFGCPIPDDGIMQEIEEKTEKFRVFVSSGGNVFGAATYIAKAFFGCNPLIFMGADFSFSYMEKFHGWDSKYDKNLGNVIRMTDVFGNSVKTWPTYANFKAWFDWVAQSVPGLYINCTEGGTFGSYPGGNIRHVIQMTLADCLHMFNLHENKRDQCENPGTDVRKILF